MKDDELLELLRSDENAGTEALIKQYSGLVYSVVRNILAGQCDSSEIEDCVTDVFLRFRGGLSTFVPKASVKNYLAVIARNTALNCIRNKCPTYSVDDDFFLELPDGGDLEEEVCRKLLLRSVLDEIKRMGSPDRDILMRKYYFLQSSKEIARSLGMSAQAVDTRAHRAVERLKEKFGGQL